MGLQALAKVASEYDGEEDGSLLSEHRNGNEFRVLAHYFVEDTFNTYHRQNNGNAHCVPKIK